jgi:hypothetical protein
MSDAPRSRALTWPRIRRMVLRAIIAAVLAAAAIAIYAIIVGTFSVVQQKLLLVVLVFLGFAFFALFDAGVLSRRSDRLAVISVAVALYLLVAGILKVALADGEDSFREGDDFSVWAEFARWLAMAFVARVALLWVWMLHEVRRAVRLPMLRLLAVATTVLVVVLAVLLTLPLIFERTHFADAYWRATAVTAVLALLGTALVPLLRWFFRERHPAATAAPPGIRRLAWPRFEDGTPLPADAEGRPDYSVLTDPTPVGAPDSQPGTVAK